MRTLLLFIAICQSSFVFSQSSSLGNSTIQRAVRQNGFFFTSPLLDCEYSHIYVPPFEEELKTLLQDALEEGHILECGIYFKQLNNGYSFGISEQKKFTPASLLKVADMMYVLKLSEQNPGLLNEEITFIHNPRIEDTESILESGNSYSVQHYLEEMIVRSDNQAMATLDEYFEDFELWKHVFDDLGILVQTSASSLRIVSPKNYSLLFEVLFNATYLNPRNSNFALSLLNNTHFIDGILAGIPDTTLNVSSKYGFRVWSEKLQLHETAIVYLQETPYLLTVMTMGEDGKDLANFVKKVSNVVYRNCFNAAQESNEAISSRFTTKAEFTSHLLDCHSAEMYPSFRDKIQQEISYNLLSPEVNKISLYFRHLNSGRHFMVNEDFAYKAPGLKKVPYMMAVLKAMEKNPELKTIELEYNEVRKPNSQTELKLGGKYSLIDLVKLLIRDDDEALSLIVNSSLDQNSLWSSLLYDLGIEHLLVNEQLTNELKIEDVAIFFRVLYNATYLSRQSSEKALAFLSKYDIPRGLRSGIPSDEYAAVKHSAAKSNYDKGIQVDMHGAGIVYAEGNPYLLVVMTQGTDPKELQKSLVNLSSMIYREVSKISN